MDYGPIVKSRRVDAAISMLRTNGAVAPRHIGAMRVVEGMLQAWNRVTFSDRAPPGVRSCKLDSNAKVPGLIFEKTKKPSATPKPGGSIVLYFHGGAFCLGQPSTYRALLGRLCSATEATVVALDYPRPPEHRYPFPDKSCLAAYIWLLDQGIPSSDIIFAGDSAGGCLAISVARMVKAKGLPQPAGILLFSPWVDLLDIESDSWFENENVDYLYPDLALYFARGYVGGRPAMKLVDGDNKLAEIDAKLWDISPVNAGDLAGLPPVHVELGSYEVLKDQIIHFTNLLSGASVHVEVVVEPGQVHVFPLFAPIVGNDHPARKCFDRAASFMKRVVANTA